MTSSSSKSNRVPQKAPSYWPWRLRLLQHVLAQLRGRAAHLMSLPRRLQRRWALSATGIALALSVGGLPLPHASPLPTAPQATITVDASAAGNGVSAGDGCSIVEAILNANNDDQSGSTECEAGSGADTIQLPASATFTYTTPFGGPDNALPIITSEITIEGNGSTIERDGSAASTFRLIRVDGPGDLTLKETTITGGAAGFGAGLYTRYGTVTVTDSTITGNYSTNLGGGMGSHGGTITISNSTVSNNSAPGNGGGIHVRRSSTLTIGDSTFTDNSVGLVGGGLGVFGRSSATITNSTVRGNEAHRGGGMYTNSSVVTVQNSTFSGNSANIDAYSRGGGIASHLGSSVTLSNSTLSGNTAEDRGGGVDTYRESTVTVQNSTITDNTAGSGGGVASAGNTRPDNDVRVTLIRSIVSGNRATTQGNELLRVDDGILISQGDNILGDGGETSSAAFVRFSPAGNDYVATSDQQNVPLASILDPTLQDNGGPTLTHALVSGSPAIDIAPTGPATDQRGYARPEGSGFDAGAVEYNASPLSTTIALFDTTSVNEGIQLAWATVSEETTAGFDLYRSTSPDDLGEKVNTELIPAQNTGLPQGASYTLLDEDVLSGILYFYTLEVWDVDGTSALNGPIMGAYLPPTAVMLGTFESGSGGPSLVGGMLALMLVALEWVRRRATPQ